MTMTARAMIGESPLFKRVVAVAERFALSRIPVLLVGETGTGKELLAHHIHNCSGRRGQFVDVNCGAFPPAILEGLLFGHRRGAFTGAVTDAAGLIVRAEGGTLFLDELPSLPLEGQAKLLRVLETRELRRVGDTHKQIVDFRVIAAAQEDIVERVETDQFRRDLYHRVAGARIMLPSLRERPEDIAVLARHFAAANDRGVSADALVLLSRQPWHGNIRELRVVIERAVVLTDDPILTSVAIAEALDRHNEYSGAESTREQFVSICAANGWNPVRIAQEMMISRATLYRRLREHGIRLREVSKSHKVSPSLETS